MTRDEQGRVNGIAPGEPGYARAALSSPTRQVLFPKGQQAGNWRELTFFGGSRLAFYLIQDSTTEDWLATNPQNSPSKGALAFFSVEGTNPDQFDHVHTQDLGSGIWQYQWEDLTGGGDLDFDDVVFNVSQPGLKIPGEQGQTVPIQLTWVSTDAARNNEMGLFWVDDATGRIGNLLPGDPGYIAAALSSERHQVVFTRGQTEAVTNLELPSGKFIAWYFISEGTTAQFLADNPSNQLRNAPVAFFSLAPIGPVALTRNDDYYTEQPLPLDFTLEFFGNHFSEFYLNNNGNITFTKFLGQYTADGFPNALPIVAPFWADVDTRGEASAQVHLAKGISKRGRPFIQIDWPDVGYYRYHTDKLNDFTLYIEDDPTGDLIAFFYRNLEWTTGDASGGSNGWGGVGAQIGFNAGDGKNYISLGRPATPGDLLPFNHTHFIFKLDGEGQPKALGEPGLDSWTVELVDVATGKVVASAVTHSVDSDGDGQINGVTEQGHYQFNHLAAGTYRVRQISREGWSQSFPGSQTYLVTLSENAHLKDLNFGNSRIYFYPVRAIDPDGDTLTYKLLESPTGATIDSHTGAINWFPTEAGPYQFRLLVEDGRGGQAIQEFTLSVKDNNPNRAPTITSTAPTQAAIDRPYGYRLTASDDNEDVLFYDLADSPEGMTIDREWGILRWTPTEKQIGTHTVSVKVTDGRGGEATQAFTLEVVKELANQLPVIKTTPPKAATVGQLYQYAVGATDPDGEALSWSLLVHPDGMSVDPDTGKILWVPTSEQRGTYQVILRASDGQGGVSVQDFSLPVAPANRSPVVTSQSVSQAGINLPYRYQVRAQDEGGASLSFLLDIAPAGMTINETTGLLQWQPTEQQLGKYPVALTVRDGQGAETAQAFTLTVVAQVTNSSPIITSTPGTAIQLGRTYFYQFVAEDPNGDPLDYQVKTGPDGLTIDQNGRVTWKPAPEQFGEHSVTLSVSDGRGGTVEQSLTIDVVAQSRHQVSPITSTPHSYNATVGQTYAYNATATGPDGDVRLWSLKTAPEGMSIDPVRGTLRWTPAREQVGTHAVEIQVVDAQGAIRGQAFTLTVRGVNLAPTIASVPLTQAAAGQPYRYQVAALDAEGEGLSYHLIKAPDGMAINASTGVIEWLPTLAQVGFAEVTVAVSDTLGAVTTQTYSLSVQKTAMNAAPTITSTPLFLAPVGKAYTYQVSATDPEGDSLSYQLLKAPAGMSIDAVSGLLSWSNPVAGGHSVVVRVNDGSSGATQAFTLTALVNHLPILKSTKPPATVTLGEIYRYDVIATDPDGSRLTYGLDSSSQQKGMTIDELGRLSWTPTTAQVGTHNVAITITDGAGASIQQTFSVRVEADALAPKVQLVPSLQPVALGESVTLVVSATDNVGVKFLNLLVNGKAVTLDANGLYAFTPDSVGEVSAIATAIDAAGNQSTATTTFSVLDLSDVTAPVIKLPSLSGKTFTAPTEILGTVSDDNLLYYTLSAAQEGTENFQEIWKGTNSVSDGVLGTFDPSLLANDAYTLRLTAVDAGGNSVTLDETVNVEGNLKLGNFQLSFTDLTIPVSGIPITVTRTYDTLTSSTKDEFGYGWRLEFRDTDLRTSLGKDQTYETFGILSKGFKEGDKVYLTLPGGKREAYTFKPELDPLGAYLQAWAGGFGLDEDPGLYHPVFVSESGSNNKLTVSDVLLVRSANGQFAGLGGLLYNPVDVYFGGQYTLTTKEGIVYEIDAQTGDLLTAIDTNGNQLTFSDAGITSDTGVEVKFGRDAQGRITTITDPMKNKVKYEYDAKGDLSAVTDRQENTTKFEYNEERAHYLQKIIDPLQRTAARIEYDEKGRLKKTLDATENSVTIDYDPENSLQTVLDALGNPTTYEYDIRGNVVRAVDALGNQTRMEYDSSNNLIKLINANNLVTKYTYDERGNLTSRSEEYCGCPTVTPGTSYYTYDKYGNQTSIVMPTGASLMMDYDRFGNLLSMKDGKGNLIQSFTYDAYGRVTSESDSSGTTYYGDYDRFGNPRWTKDTSGNITTTTYDHNGRLISMTEADGSISTFTYDKLGRETLADYGDGIRVKYDYTGSGGDWTLLEAPTIGKIERKFTDDGKLAGWVTPDGGTPTFYYDKAGRLWKETDASGNVTTEYSYDAAGRVTNIKDVRTGATLTKKYDTGGRVIEEIDPLNIYTKSIYDQRTGKLTQTERGKYILATTTGQLVEDPTVQKQIWKYEYNGTRTTVIDPLGRKTTSVMDEYYLPIETIYNNGQKTQASYLYANNLQEAKDYPTKIVDIGGNDRKFTYDSWGRLKTATDLGNGTYTYDYGENGLSKITSPTGETLQYGYDELGNLAKVINSDGTIKQMIYRATDNRLGTITLPSGETIIYDYDGAGRIKSQTSSDRGTVSFTYTPEGAVKTMTDSSGMTTYHYDDRTGALSGIDSPNGSSIAYTYDLFGRLKTLTEKGSATGTAYVTEYDYDAFGNLKSVKDPTGGVTTMKYDGVNRLVERVLPNGIKSTYEYDDLDRVKSIVHTNSSGEVLASVTYERSGIGEPSKITREDGSYVKLAYDEALRVKKESYYFADGTLFDETAYTYDAAGKRQVQSSSGGDRTYNYTPGYQLDTIVETGETENYDYDANGRLTLISRDGKTLDLNHDTYDRLTEVENETTGETVKYII